MDASRELQDGSALGTALREALDRYTPPAASALALESTFERLMELAPELCGAVRTEPGRVCLELALGSEVDGAAVEEILRRFPRSLRSESLRCGEGLQVMLRTPRRAEGDSMPPGPATRLGRIEQILSTLEQREGELIRIRDELDDTNRGVVALYSELDTHSRELELADQRKNEFLAMLAHELRNPLAALQLAAEDIERPDADHPRASAVMQRQLRHLARMVDDLLDVSRITRGKVEVEPTRLDLRRAVRAAVEPRAALVEEAGLELRLKLPERSVWIEGDPTRIEQVVVNLVDNAVKYTDPPGRIDIEVRGEGPQAELKVSDTGRGMTSEELRDAWELFVQHGGQGLDRGRGGLGIGLTLVREIVTMHAGSVQAHSEGLDRGTSFRVRLPRVDGPPTGKHAAVGAGRSPEGMRLLLVEDNEDFREMLAARLRRRGCEVEEAEDGAEALEILRSMALPDVVVTDVGLPTMDGYALAKAIRSDPALRELRLIALTGYGGDTAAERVRSAGFDVHLVKPVPMDELMASLHPVDARSSRSG